MHGVLKSFWLNVAMFMCKCLCVGMPKDFYLIIQAFKG